MKRCCDSIQSKSGRVELFVQIPGYVMLPRTRKRSTVIKPMAYAKSKGKCALVVVVLVGGMKTNSETIDKLYKYYIVQILFIKNGLAWIFQTFANWCFLSCSYLHSIYIYIYSWFWTSKQIDRTYMKKQWRYMKIDIHVTVHEAMKSVTGIRQIEYCVPFESIWVILNPFIRAINVTQIWFGLSWCKGSMCHIWAQTVNSISLKNNCWNIQKMI